MKMRLSLARVVIEWGWVSGGENGEICAKKSGCSFVKYVSGQCSESCEQIAKQIEMPVFPIPDDLW